jgi:hypothetical protein
MFVKRLVFAFCTLMLAAPAIAQAPDASGPAATGGCPKSQGMHSGKHCGGRHGQGGHGKHGGKGHGYAMRHANPMPNLMKIVKQHGDRLGLSDDQTQALSAWRDNHMKRMHARADSVMQLEAELAKAALDGRPKAELMGIATRIMTERTQIIATKANCRDNMRRILTPEQYQKVLSLHKG